jgi:transposase InsO family protein
MVARDYVSDDGKYSAVSGVHQESQTTHLLTPLPDYPWQMVGTDLFELKEVHYFIIVDYFSRYPDEIKLSSTASSAIISTLQAVFSRHGIPDVVRSNNGPQYASLEFAHFARAYGFHHDCSTPKFPQSNGQVERTVQTVKQLLKQSSDPYKSLLNYRSIPFPWCGRSPSELLMGRRLYHKRTSI